MRIKRNGNRNKYVQLMLTSPQYCNAFKNHLYTHTIKLQNKDMRKLLIKNIYTKKNKLHARLKKIQFP